MKDVKPLRPFQLWALQNFPFIEADFDVLTNYEMMCKIVEYLNNVIDNANKQNEVISDVVTLADNLKDYVDNYFENLDIQTEINNKLDDMAESGQLTEIIAQYLELAGILAFNTKSDLKNADNLINGSITRTLGTTTYNDGYGYFYKIRDILNTDVIDDDNLLALTNFPLLVAEKIPDTTINNLLTDVSNIQLDVTNLQTDVTNLENEVYKLNGKKIQIFGDSISDPNLLSNCWANFLEDKGAVVTNRSVSGMRISQTDGWADLVDDITGDYDINIVFCGVNDSSSNVEIGDKYSNDNTTFCGAVDHLFGTIANKWPNAINYVILPIKTSYEKGYNIGELKLYDYILYLYAQKYNFLVMNLYRTAPMLNPGVTVYKNLYQTDGLHPTAAYQPILAQTIINYLEYQKSDSMGSEIIDVTNCLTRGGTFSYKSVQIYLTTDKMIHFQYYGECGNDQIYSNHVWLGELKSFLFAANSIPFTCKVYGSTNYYSQISYNNKDVNVDIYDSPSGNLTIQVTGTWYAWFLP